MHKVNQCVNDGSTKGKEVVCVQIGHEPIIHGFGLHHQLWLIFKLTRFRTKKVNSGHVCENVSGRYVMIWEDPTKLNEKEKLVVHCHSSLSASWLCVQCEWLPHTSASMLTMPVPSNNEPK